MACLCGAYSICFRALHGPPSGSSFFWLVDCPYFELFEPHRRQLQPFRASSPGTIHSDEARHVNAEVVRLDRPHALGDPFLPAVNSVEVCSLLMLYGGAASSWAAQYSMQLRVEYAGMDADVARTRSSAVWLRLWPMVPRCTWSAAIHTPSHPTVVTTAANAHVQLLLAERRPRVGIASSQLIYQSGVKTSVNRARTLTVGNWMSPAFAKVPLS